MNAFGSTAPTLPEVRLLPTGAPVEPKLAVGPVVVDPPVVAGIVAVEPPVVAGTVAVVAGTVATGAVGAGAIGAGAIGAGAIGAGAIGAGAVGAVGAGSVGSGIEAKATLPNIAEIAVNMATVEIIFFIKSPSHTLIEDLILDPIFLGIKGYDCL